MRVRFLLLLPFAGVCLASSLQANQTMTNVPITKEIVDTFVRCPFLDYQTDPATACERFLHHLLKRRVGLDSAVRSLARKYALKPAVARELAEVIILRYYMYSKSCPEYLKSVDFKQRLQDRMVELVRNSGHQEAIIRYVAETFSNEDDCTLELLKELVEGSVQPDQSAFVVADQVGWPPNWLDLLSHAPSNRLPLWMLVGFDGFAIPRSWRLAILERLMDRFPVASLKDPLHILALRVHREAVIQFLDAGLVREGIARFEGLPATARDRLLKGGPLSIKGCLDGLPLEDRDEESNWKPEEAAHLLPVELAAAYLLEDRVEDARKMLGRITWTTEVLEKRRARAKKGDRCHSPVMVKRVLLERLLAGTSDDPFEVLQSFLANECRVVSIALGSSALWLKLLEPTLTVHGYRRVTEYLGSYWDGDRWPPKFGCIWSNHGECRVEPDGTPGLLERALDERVSAPGEEALGVRARAMHAALLSYEPPGAGQDVIAEASRRMDPMEATIGNRLSVTGLSAFSEVRLPANEIASAPSPHENKPVVPRADAAPEPKIAPLPPGHVLVRFETEGERAVAISVSQALDPMGETSMGGYWVHLSRDGGKSWESSYYIGLSQGFPYRVLRDSKHKLLAGDFLEPEVMVKEIDPASITFPPIAMRTKREDSGLFLSIPLSALVLDSDGDGLTDLAEERLLLDPRSKDSDGDGFEDGADSMPNVAFVESEDDVPAVLQRLMQRVFEKGWGALVEPAGPCSIEDVVADYGKQGKPRGLNAFAFVEGNRLDFAGVRPERPTLVFSERECERLYDLRGAFYPVRIILVVFNQERTAGFAIWSASWTGGGFKFRKIRGGWELEEVSRWIT
jgi:hypothetical protein